jgi:hypothetical protein
MPFDLLLRILDGTCHQPMLDRNALLHAEPTHDALNAIRTENSHQIIFQREIESR